VSRKRTFWYQADLQRFSYNQNFRFKILETFRVKWKAFFHPGKEPHFQLQTCNLISKSKIASQGQEARNMNVASPLLRDNVDNLDEEI